MLGAYGGRLGGKSATSLLLNDSVAIDAGNLLTPLGQNAAKLDHIFLTHSHMDHIADLPFLIDAFFTERTKPLCVYGLPNSIRAIKRRIFNDSIWSDFTEIKLPKARKKAALIMREIAPPFSYVIDGVKLSPFETNHVIKSAGYVIEKGGKKLAFTSDTGKCASIWDMLNADPNVSSLIIETSFPSRFEQLARISGHLTPKTLNEELSNLKRDIRIYINHAKPDFLEEISAELLTFDRTKNAKILDDGEVIEL
jgi:ribonuclease BN (tRNA processing enzyme)